jgi:hypothetical protein
VQMATLSERASRQRRCTLTIHPTSVRDVCIPLGGFANVVCSHKAPRLPGTGASVRKKVRTAPPVLLPRRGEVALPGAGSTREFTCDAAAVLPILAAEPLLIELWHTDKYTRDVLLGVAAVDLAEVLSARPIVNGASTSHRQEQTVAFIAPEEGLLPAALSAGAAARVGGRNVALLDVTVLVEYAPPPARPASAERGGVGERASSALGALSRSTANRPTAHPPPSTTGGGTGGGAPIDEATVARSMQQLETWRRREESRFKAALAEKEKERLALLEREWKVQEARRANEARAQARAMAATTKELKHKLAQLAQQEDILHSTAEQLALRSVALEEQVAIDRAELLATSEQELSRLRAEGDGVRGQLRDAIETSSTLRERANVMGDRQARAETEAGVWREAHDAAAARALSLESDKGRLSASLAQEQARVVSLTEAAQRQQKQRREEREEQQRAAAAAAAAVAELPERLAEIRRQAEVPLVVDEARSGGAGFAPGLAGEAEREVDAVQRRLREHSRELQREAKEIDEFRSLLAERAQRSAERGPPPTNADALRDSRAAAWPSGGGASAATTPQAAQGRTTARTPSAAGGSAATRTRGVTSGSRPAYQLRSLATGLGDEESWWERYSRDVLPAGGGGDAGARGVLVAEVE